MSHTIGQAEPDNQQLNPNTLQDSQHPVTSASSGDSSLKDGDYEFLYNQLLEGVAHGWHDRRIIKFFQQLGDRGKQEDWVAWLERLRLKVITLPVQSKQQLGTMMIRLGELTQSAKEVNKIGAISNRIGRELLFGDTGDIIWEYAGPDLSLDSLKLEIESESELADRLPTEFTALGSLSEAEEEPSTPEVTFEDSIFDEVATDSKPALDSGVNTVNTESVLENLNEQSIKPELDKISLEEAVSEQEKLASETDLETSTSLETEMSELSLEEDTEVIVNLEEAAFESTSDKPTPTATEISDVRPEKDNKTVSEPEKLASETDLETSTSLETEMSELSLEEDAEVIVNLEEAAFESTSDKSTPTATETGELRLEEDASPSLEFSPNSQMESAADNSQVQPELLTAFQQPQPSSEKTNILDNDLLSAEPETISSESIDLEQVMNLIQQDPELAEQISQKLNMSSSDLTLSTSKTDLAANRDVANLELIESWFNLGLKQVSAGEFNKAIASWEKALKINPNLSEAWHNRGSALGRLGKYKKAVKSFQQALAIDPNNYQAWNDCAHALYQLKKWPEAVNSWNNALKIMPSNHLFWYNRGCGLEQLEKWTEAIISYEKSLEIKPDFQPARLRYINLVADDSRSN